MAKEYRVKVTGYIYPDPDEQDPDDHTGLTNEAYESYATGDLLCLSDLIIERVRE